MTRNQVTQPVLSVIIPTCNRRESLLCTLESLACQTLSAERFELIVVDDGSSDGTKETLDGLDWPFSLICWQQVNSGGVHSRNKGAELAAGQVLVFLDDDMTLYPEYLENLADRLLKSSRIIARGRLEPWDGYTSKFAQRYSGQSEEMRVSVGNFSSNNLAVRSVDFWLLGAWEDLLPGVQEHRGGIWSDLAFAVRASQHGYQLITVEDARIVHRDYAIQSLSSACARAYMVSKLAVPVVSNNPDLRRYMPMIHDKEPIEWDGEPLTLILRKVARKVVSSAPMMWLMEKLILIEEQRKPTSGILTRLYRWQIGGYIYHGYRDGLLDYLGTHKTPGS